MIKKRKQKKSARGGGSYSLTVTAAQRNQLAKRIKILQKELIKVTKAFDDMYSVLLKW